MKDPILKTMNGKQKSYQVIDDYLYAEVASRKQNQNFSSSVRRRWLCNRENIYHQLHQTVRQKPGSIRHDMRLYWQWGGQPFARFTARLFPSCRPTRDQLLYRMDQTQNTSQIAKKHHFGDIVVEC
jgi:hypothetical protein